MSAQIKTLAVFGDSISKGVVYNGQNKKYSLRKKHGYSVLSDHGFIVKNFAKMGSTVNNGLQIMQSRLKPDDNYDIILLEFGGNDCDFCWDKIAKNPFDSHLPKTPVEDFKSIYIKMIELAKKSAKKVYITNLLPLDADKYFKFISNFGSPENILKWLGDKYILYRYNEWYSHKVEEIAQNNGIDLIDTRSEFLHRHDFTELFCDDGIHPSEKGYEIIDNILLNTLK